MDSLSLSLVFDEERKECRSLPTRVEVVVQQSTAGDSDRGDTSAMLCSTNVGQRSSRRSAVLSPRTDSSATAGRSARSEGQSLSSGETRTDVRMSLGHQRSALHLPRRRVILPETLSLDRCSSFSFIQIGERRPLARIVHGVDRHQSGDRRPDRSDRQFVVAGRNDAHGIDPP